MVKPSSASTKIDIRKAKPFILGLDLRVNNSQIFDFKVI